jgi:hypothetical protein
MPSLITKPLSLQLSVQIRLVSVPTTPLSCEHAGRKWAYSDVVLDAVVAYDVVVAYVVILCLCCIWCRVTYDAASCRLKKPIQKELGFYAAGIRWTTLVLWRFQQWQHPSKTPRPSCNFIGTVQFHQASWEARGSNTTRWSAWQRQGGSARFHVSPLQRLETMYLITMPFVHLQTRSAFSAYYMFANRNRRIFVFADRLLLCV